MTNYSATATGFVEDVGRSLSSRMTEMGTVFLLLFAIIIVMGIVIIWGVRKRDQELKALREELERAKEAQKAATDELVEELRNQLASRAELFANFQKLTEAVASASKLVEDVSKGYQAALRDMASRNRS